MDKHRAVRILATVASREIDPQIRKEAKEAIEFIEASLKWSHVVLRVSAILDAQGRVENQYTVVKIVGSYEEAWGIAVNRNRSATRQKNEIFFICSVEGDRERKKDG